MRLTYVRDIWLPAQSPRFPMQCWSNQLWLISLIYLTDIFDIHGISSGSTILSWQSSAFTSFCALFVQFGSILLAIKAWAYPCLQVIFCHKQKISHMGSSMSNIFSEADLSGINHLTVKKSLMLFKYFKFNILQGFDVFVHYLSI